MVNLFIDTIYELIIKNNKIKNINNIIIHVCMYLLIFFFVCGRRYSEDECSLDTGRKSLTFDLYDKKLSESIHDVQKKFHEITVYENSTVKGKYCYTNFFFYNFAKM